MSCVFRRELCIVSLCTFDLLEKRFFELAFRFSKPAIAMCHTRVIHRE